MRKVTQKKTQEPTFKVNDFHVKDCSYLGNISNNDEHDPVVLDNKFTATMFVSGQATKAELIQAMIKQLQRIKV